MDIGKLNSLVELYFKKTDEVDVKRPFLKWLKPDKQTYNWEDVTERIYKLTLKIKSLGRGKFGRILAIPYTNDNEDICQILIQEGHAVEYWGGKKTKVWGDY